MVELLATYSIAEIIIFLFMIAVAAQESIKLIDFFYDKLKRHFLGIESAPRADAVRQIQEKVDLLIASDKDNIRGWVVQQHQYLKKHPEDLDEMMMDCLEKRYGHYKAEGGNSYIDQLIENLRTMHKGG